MPFFDVFRELNRKIEHNNRIRAWIEYLKDVKENSSFEEYEKAKQRFRELYPNEKLPKNLEG